ncbi:MAG: radical SAM protein [Chromatiaceae bacterium]
MYGYFEKQPDSPIKTTTDPYALIFRDSENQSLRARREEILSSQDPSSWASVDFPLELAVEIAAWCNLKCVICPVPTSTRPKRFITTETFRKVVEQVKGEKGFLFGPGGYGEVMLHAGWADLLEHAKEQGIGPTAMITNGTVLTEENAARLVKMGLDALVISIDGTTPETYAKIRVGGSLEKVEANVRRLIRIRGDKELPRLCLRIIRMKETDAEVQDFIDHWNALLCPGDLIQVQAFQDWVGKVEDRSVEGVNHRSREGRLPCRMLWRHLAVRADGTVSACCRDIDGELTVGNIEAGDTIREIWHGDKLNDLRRLHLQKRFEDIPLCKACTSWI